MPSTYQFTGWYEPDVVMVVGSLFISTGSAAPVIRRAEGVQSVSRESAGTYKIKYTRRFPANSLLYFSATPWHSSSNGPNTIGFQVKHVDPTNATGAELFIQLVSGTLASGSTVMGRAVADPSIHVTASIATGWGK